MSRHDARAVLSDRQREVLAALERLAGRAGVAPSLRELADEVGLASPSSVLRHVRVLWEHELVDRRASLPPHPRGGSVQGQRRWQGGL